MRVAFMSSALTVLALASALAQPADRPRPPPPQHPTVPNAPPRPNAPPAGREQSGRESGGGPAGAQSGAAMSAPHQAASSVPDQTFLARAAHSGLAQVELARLAEQKAASPSVREFARQTAMDQDQANRSLRELTEGEAAATPDQMDAEFREVREALGRLSGAEFDIEYMRLAVQGHQRMATLMEYVIGSGKDAQVQRFAADRLPRVFAHLAVARQLLDQASMQNPQVAGAPPRKVTGMPTPQTPRANAD
jgi:putative membrane protein